MILFIDIETVPVYANIQDLSEPMRKHWKHKLNFIRLKEGEEEDLQKAWRGHAGIFAEWSKVICIGLGYINSQTNEMHLKAITNDDEQKLLLEFKEMIDVFRKKSSIKFCGHNIKEFDIPFICRRMIIHEIDLPDELNLAGMKPWENQHIDTMELWRFGEYKRFTSLDLLANVLNVESSKQDIDGSMVADVYYEENDSQKIVDYCLRDVVTTAKIYFRLTGKKMNDLQISYS